MQTSVKLYLGLSLFFLFPVKNIPASQPEKEAIYSQYDAFDFQAEGMKTFNNEPEKSKQPFLRLQKLIFKINAKRRGYLPWQCSPPL